MLMKQPPPLSRLGDSLKLAVVFQVAWLVVAGVSVLSGRSINGSLLVGNLIILFAPVVIEVLTRIRLPTALHVHFHIFVTASSFLGSIIGFYALVPNWDTYVHLDSAVLTTWLGFFVVRQAEGKTKAQLPKWFAITAAVAVSMGLASLWEIYEYLSDMIVHTNMQVGGLDDTMIDMMAAVVGSCIAVALAVWLRAPKSVLPKSLC